MDNQAALATKVGLQWVDSLKPLRRSHYMGKERPSQPMATEAGARMSKGWSLSTFRQGVDAAKAGQPPSVNPYETGTDQAAIWLGGWQVGTSV